MQEQFSPDIDPLLVDVYRAVLFDDAFKLRAEGVGHTALAPLVAIASELNETHRAIVSRTESSAPFFNYEGLLAPKDIVRRYAASNDRDLWADCVKTGAFWKSGTERNEPTGHGLVLLPSYLADKATITTRDIYGRTHLIPPEQSVYGALLRIQSERSSSGI